MIAYYPVKIEYCEMMMITRAFQSILYLMPRLLVWKSSTYRQLLYPKTFGVYYHKAIDTAEAFSAISTFKLFTKVPVT
jgi:hypothetical protein